jgi:hypothetical protein
MYAKYVGLSAATAELIERLRTAPGESEDAIIRRALSGLAVARPAAPRIDYVVGCDLGSGVALAQNETIQCYIRTGDMALREPDGVAVARGGALFISGERVVPQRGAWLQAALKRVQQKTGQRVPVAVNAWEHWFVTREGKRMRLADLRSRVRRRRG